VGSSAQQSQVHVVERASFRRLSAAYKKAGRAIAAGAIPAAAGISAFAWGGANPPEEGRSPVIIPEPTEVVVSIDEEDRRSAGASVGRLYLATVEAVAVEAVGESHRVASVATRSVTPRCSL
jgi:hypothetical protein